MAKVFIIGVHHWCSLWGVGTLSCIIACVSCHRTCTPLLQCSKAQRATYYTAVTNRGWSRLTLLPPVSGAWPSPEKAKGDLKAANGMKRGSGIDGRPDEDVSSPWTSACYSPRQGRCRGQTTNTSPDVVRWQHLDDDDPTVDGRCTLTIFFSF